MTNLEMVAAELEAAKKKHPKFVDYVFRGDAAAVVLADLQLDITRNMLAMAITYGDCSWMKVLTCEMWEAASAYAHGDLAHAKQELAQCAAVCIRAMEYVQNEMEKTKC